MSKFEWIGEETTLCVGKEWHRFPTRFILPQNVSIRFVQSEFRGQLPGIFARWPKGLADIPYDFNDDNKEVFMHVFL